MITCSPYSFTDIHKTSVPTKKPKTLLMVLGSGHSRSFGLYKMIGSDGLIGEHRRRPPRNRIEANGDETPTPFALNFNALFCPACDKLSAPAPHIFASQHLVRFMLRAIGHASPPLDGLFCRRSRLPVAVI